jgi:hypothetical protein
MIVPQTWKSLTKISSSSKNVTRPHTQHVRFDNGVLMATDGVILAVVPVRDSDDDFDGLLPNDLIPGSSVELGSERVENMDCGISIVRPENVNGPDYVRLFPSEEHEPEFSVRIDAALLFELAKAICGKDRWTKGSLKVTLDFYKDKPTKVTPLTPVESGACGLIARIDE